MEANAHSPAADSGRVHETQPSTETTTVTAQVEKLRLHDDSDDNQQEREHHEAGTNQQDHNDAGKDEVQREGMRPVRLPPRPQHKVKGSLKYAPYRRMQRQGTEQQRQRANSQQSTEDENENEADA